MREAHAHIAGYGEALSIPSLTACSSLAECLDLVHREASAAAPGAFIRFHSARTESWPERKWPTLADLDRVAPNHPCLILSFDYHAAAGNSAALRHAGLSPGQRVPPNGEVCVDSTTGHATGLLLEHAAYRAWDAAPSPTPSERRGHVTSALRSLAQLGYSEVHDLHSQPWLGPVLADIERSGELSVNSVWLYPPALSLAEACAGRGAWESGSLRLAGGKVFADGTLNSRTAMMLHPYREPLHDLPRGRAMVTERDLDESVSLAESLGLHLAVHAIGDAAVRMVLDSIERTGSRRTDAAKWRGNRHRIEHAELVDKADVPRFAELGVVCSVQPCHLLADVAVLTSQLPHRLDRVLPLRDLIDAGCKPGGPDGLLWFGSDVPVVRADAGDSLQAAVHRRAVGAGEVAAIAPDQAIREAECWAAFARPANNGTCHPPRR